MGTDKAARLRCFLNCIRRWLDPWRVFWTEFVRGGNALKEKQAVNIKQMYSE